MEGKEEPLIVSFGVGIVVHYEIVLFYFAICGEIGVFKVTALEMRVEFMVSLSVGLLGGLVVFRVVVGGLSDGENVGWVGRWVHVNY